MMGFSGHNMARDIMRQTSMPMQMREYVDTTVSGRAYRESHPERLDWEYESRKVDLTPTYDSKTLDIFGHQARKEMEYVDHRIKIGLGLIGRGRSPDNSFETESIRLAESTLNISRKKDASEIMLHILDTQRKESAELRALLQPQQDARDAMLGSQIARLSVRDFSYLRDTLDVDLPISSCMPFSEPFGSASWTRDTLDANPTFYAPSTRPSDLTYLRDTLDVDLTPRLRTPVVKIETSVPWAKTLMEPLPGQGLVPLRDNHLDFRRDFFDPVPSYDIITHVTPEPLWKKLKREKEKKKDEEVSRILNYYNT